jgi:hypothetical protein
MSDTPITVAWDTSKVTAACDNIISITSAAGGPEPTAVYSANPMLLDRKTANIRVMMATIESLCALKFFTLENLNDFKKVAADHLIRTPVINENIVEREQARALVEAYFPGGI